MKEEDNDVDNDYATVYIDGSRIEGKVGAGLSVWTGGVEINKEKIKLENYCTVFQAELYRIYRATKVADKVSNIKIMSDTRLALQIITGAIDRHPIAFEIRRGIQEKRN